MRYIVVWTVFWLTCAGGVVFVVWLDQRVVKPFLDRRTARVLGITVPELHAIQREMWRRFRARLRHPLRGVR